MLDIWWSIKRIVVKNLQPGLHHRLVKIHPFANYNGRHARIMTNAVLESILDASPIEWGTSTLDVEGERRQNYINALRAADNNDYRS